MPGDLLDGSLLDGWPRPQHTECMSDGTNQLGNPALPSHPIVLLMEALTPLVHAGWSRLSDEDRTMALLLGGAVGCVVVGWIARDAMG